MDHTLEKYIFDQHKVEIDFYGGITKVIAMLSLIQKTMTDLSNPKDTEQNGNS